MRWLLACGLALAPTVLGVTTLARTPAAQTADGVLEACEPAKRSIDARVLPAAVLDPGRRPVAGRTIEDGGVGSVVPPPGESVHAEVLTTAVAEELEIGRHEDGTIELGFVGEDVEASEDPAKANGPGECSGPEYTDGQRRVPEDSPLRYEVNKASTSSELRPGEAADAIRRAGTRVANTKSNCRMGDRVPASLVYEGKMAQGANIDGFNGANGGIVRSGYDDTVASDIKINKGDFRWTTSPRSCRGRYDLEGVMTHERGHTFGLGHVPEAGHGNLTMSTTINGACQLSERTLGRGDVRGLGQKYR